MNLLPKNVLQASLTRCYNCEYESCTPPDNQKTASYEEEDSAEYSAGGDSGSAMLNQQDRSEFILLFWLREIQIKRKMNKHVFKRYFIKLFRSNRQDEVVSSFDRIDDGGRSSSACWSIGRLFGRTCRNQETPQEYSYQRWYVLHSISFTTSWTTGLKTSLLWLLIS